MKVVPSSEFTKADLILDCLYEGGRAGHSGDDPLHLLLPVSNQGGFRTVGRKQSPKLVVLTSSGKSPDWPDELDRETGIFTYFGDNREPGRELHDTGRYGNLLLRDMFERAHNGDRHLVPPVLVFERAKAYRDHVFLGLTVPGTETTNSNSDLVAVWRQRQGQRFQNYRAYLTILAEQVIKREWIADIEQGQPLSDRCPPAWRAWVEKGRYFPLQAPRATEYREKDEQIPKDSFGLAMIEQIHRYFADQPVRFEACAVKIAELMLPNIADSDVTRPTRDGGRDAVGRYRIGTGASAVLVEFALEAKCYGLSNSVGVKELSRLISRLRHRQFGIIVTTSFVAKQAYEEIKDDAHPIIVISAVDIVRLLVGSGISSAELLERWLKSF